MYMVSMVYNMGLCVWHNSSVFMGFFYLRCMPLSSTLRRRRRLRPKAPSHRAERAVFRNTLGGTTFTRAHGKTLWAADVQVAMFFFVFSPFDCHIKIK